MARYDCRGKTAYPTFTKADGVAAYQRKKLGDVLHAYSCKHCGQFHIGQQPLNAKAGKRPRVEIED